MLLARAAAGRIEDQRLLAQGFADVAHCTDEQPDAYLVASDIKFNWQDVASKELSESERLAMRAHLEACIADLTLLLGKL